TSIVIAFFVGGSTTAAAQDTSELRREVEGLNRAMEAAVNGGDMKAAAAFYADNAVVRSAHQVAAQGRAAVDAYWAAIRQPKRWKLDVYGVSAPTNSDLVFQTGRSTLVSGSPERTSVFQFMVVWQRQRDGRLRIIADYY